MRAVFDASVVVSAVCWDGEAYMCLIKLARRQATAWGTADTLRETREAVVRQLRVRPVKHNGAGRLTWYLEQVKTVEPAPLGKQRSRDPKDDPYLAAALAARAQVIVTYDKDLLALGKPFGIEILKPAELLRRLSPRA